MLQEALKYSLVLPILDESHFTRVMAFCETVKHNWRDRKDPFEIWILTGEEVDLKRFESDLRVFGSLVQFKSFPSHIYRNELLGEALHLCKGEWILMHDLSIPTNPIQLTEQFAKSFNEVDIVKTALPKRQDTLLRQSSQFIFKRIVCRDAGVELTDCYCPIFWGKKAALEKIFPVTPETMPGAIAIKAIMLGFKVKENRIHELDERIERPSFVYTPIRVWLLEWMSVLAMLARISPLHLFAELARICIIPAALFWSSAVIYQVLFGYGFWPLALSLIGVQFTLLSGLCIIAGLMAESRKPNP
ncbi:MAG: hypothetical protein MK193_09175 [Lentisphaeria bacterium]|nr:hypothetical protein [Lentisphaeria bacterium]